jgi:hypothetical protein
MSQNSFKETLPEGRVINCSLFERESYTSPDGKKGEPSYKIEIAFAPGVLDDFEDRIVDEIVIPEWGVSAEKDYADDKIQVLLLNGDDLAEEREKKGKAGSAYKGLTVLRASTKFNCLGQDAPGGIEVYGPDVALISVGEQSQVYQGCYGRVLIEAKPYDVNRQKGVKFYLCAFQKTRDGDRLMADRAGAFSPVSAPEESSRAPRRRR